MFFNGSDHRVIVDKQGSVEGLAYEQVNDRVLLLWVRTRLTINLFQIGNALYWTCNNDATINRVNLTDQITNASEVESIIR